MQLAESTIFGMMNTARQELGIPLHVVDVAGCLGGLSQFRQKF